MEQDINQSFKKLLDNQCSAQELDELLAKMGDDQYKAIYDRLIINQLSEPVGQNEISGDLRERLDARLKQILDAPVHGIEDGSPKKPIFKLWPRIAAAAAVLLVAGLSIFFFNQYNSAHRHPDADQGLGLAGNDIKPGGNKAYLVLSNGKRLSLTDAANGELAKEAGVEITKTADGQLIYESRHPELVSGSRTKYSNALNTIETPRGGQYQIRLPDGSKVWLNAASKLIYPVSFNGRGQRVVELSGEAYFEIFKNKLQPFVVKSKNQEVIVLGTHFNINSYTDEPSVKTTLLEGSVRVNEAVLKPGEQSILANNQIKIAEVNTDEAIAWKNGLFAYKNTPLQNVMRQIARWYDVDIIYQNNDLPQKLLSGSVSRYDQVSGILKAIESTGTAKFKIEERKITVLP